MRIFQSVYFWAAALIALSVGLIIWAVIATNQFTQECEAAGGTVHSYYDPVEDTHEIWCE